MKIHYTRKIDRFVSRSINHRGKYWPKDTIFTYSFMGGTPFQHDYVRRGISHILDVAPGVNIVEVENDGNIRISFNELDGSWSFVGTDVLFRPLDQPTMNIGWFDDVNERNVTHEWLHTLNFAHEHIRGINWDKPKVYAAFAETGWSKRDVDINLFNYDEEDYHASEIDNDSIMKYWIDCEWTLDNKNCGEYNTELSEGDIKRLNELFPYNDQPNGPTLITEFLLELFPSKKSLDRLYETQLVIMATKLNIEANLRDLKAETIDKILNKLHESNT